MWSQNNDKHTTTLLRQQFFSIFNALLVLLISGLNIIFVARILGAEEYGILGLILTIVGIVTAFFQFGIHAGYLRAIADSEDAKVLAYTRFIFLLKNSINIILAVVISFGVMIASYVYPFQDDHIQFFILAYISYILADNVQIYEAYKFGRQRYKSAYNYRFGVAVVRLLLTVMLTWAFGIVGYLWGLVFSSLIILLYSALRKLGGDRYVQKPSKSEYLTLWREIWTIAKPSYAIKSLYSIWFRVPVVVIPFVGTLEQVGVFYFVSQVADMLRSAGAAVARVNLPYMTKHLSGRIDQYADIFFKNFSKLILLLSLIVGLAFTVTIWVYPYILNTGATLDVWAIGLFILSVYIFISITWLGSAVLYPLKKTENIIQIHYAFKLAAMILIAISAILTQNYILMFIFILLGEVGPWAYYYAYVVRILRSSVATYIWLLVITILAGNAVLVYLL